MKHAEFVLNFLFSRQRWIIHVLFWLLILAIYVVFFGRKNSNYLLTFFFVGLLMPVTISTTYFLNYYLVPRYLMKERYGFFILYFGYVLIGSLFLEMMVAMLTFIVMADVKINDMSPASIDIYFLLVSLLMVVFLGVAIKMLSFWRKSKEDYDGLMRVKIETELKFLKAQLNPHFLFNTLNNLYYLTTEKSDKAPKAILQLSEILDYVMHTGKSIFVPIGKELKQVENYIALEMLRYEDRARVSVRLEGDVSRFEIAPMMILTLIENSFKHGVMPMAANAWIDLKVEAKESLVITISNSALESRNGEGIGLKNLQGQLDHLYKDKYTLQIGDARPGVFSVTLILPGS